MKIRVLQKGGEKRDSVVEAAVRFYAAQLMSTRMCNLLNITVKMRVGGRSGRSTGMCSPRGDDISKKVRDFVLNIDRDMDHVGMLEVLAHEMVHVKQLATKQLVYKWTKKTGWRNSWEGKKLGSINTIPYRQRPWEMEAFGKQIAMKNEFINTL